MSLLEARAALSLREGVLESAMTVQPILRAVHNGTLASPVERSATPAPVLSCKIADHTSRGILHYAEIRDGTAVKMAAQCLSSREADDSLSEWELKGVETQRSNAKLALDVVRLAHAAQTHSTQLVDDEALQQEIVRVKDGLKVSRQRWKVIKGTVSAVVAGSGIDWARDERLRNMVLDPIE